jgi:hypothetical protein
MDLILLTMSQLMAASQHQYRLRRADWYSGEFIGLHFGGVGFQPWSGTTGYPDRSIVFPSHLLREFRDITRMGDARILPNPFQITYH